MIIFRKGGADMARFIWNKEKFIKEIQPLHINKLFVKMELTPSQMVTFWLTEPSVEKMLKIRKICKIDPLDYVVEGGPRYKKKGK
jgi:hypothetical protein